MREHLTFINFIYRYRVNLAKFRYICFKLYDYKYTIYICGLLCSIQLYFWFLLHLEIRSGKRSPVLVLMTSVTLFWWHLWLGTVTALGSGSPDELEHTLRKWESRLIKVSQQKVKHCQGGHALPLNPQSRLQLPSEWAKTLEG